MIAIPAADDCSFLQLTPLRAGGGEGEADA